MVQQIAGVSNNTACLSSCEIGGSYESQTAETLNASPTTNTKKDLKDFKREHINLRI